MTSYHFYGWETADAAPQSTRYPGITSPRVLYDALLLLWSAETCAPRMRDQWAS